jgi:hypothetical protein
MQDMIVVTMMAVLRFMVPVFLIAGVAYLLVRYSRAQMQSDIQAPPEAKSLTPAEWARAVTVPSAVPCWEQKHCEPAKRSSCAAYKRSHVPCWLAVQVAEGQLRDGCLTCELYHLEKRDRPYIRVIRGRRAEGAEAGVACADGTTMQAGKA